MRKLTIGIGENKEAEQLCGNREADQRLFFLLHRFFYFINPKFPVSSYLLWLYTARFVLDLFGNLIVDFLMSQLSVLIGPKL